jgi:hypothetical protein
MTNALQFSSILNRILTLGCYHNTCWIEVRPERWRGEGEMMRSNKSVILVRSATLPTGGRHSAVLDTIFRAMLACFPSCIRQGGGA